MDKNKYEIKLDELCNGLGSYAPIPDNCNEQTSIKMKNDILEIEDSITEWNSELYYKLAISYRNFTAWYLRGERNYESCHI